VRGLTRAREPILEREGHLLVADAALGDVLSGDGRTLLIEGPGGIGKTTLLHEIALRARERGFAVHQACGDDLASRLPYGILRQLFIAALEHLEPQAEHALADGPAGPAVDMLRDLRGTSTQDPRRRFLGSVGRAQFLLAHSGAG
jgi:predicted ATPase